jgi:hypothetical protein
MLKDASGPCRSPQTRGRSPLPEHQRELACRDRRSRPCLHPRPVPPAAPPPFQLLRAPREREGEQVGEGEGERNETLGRDESIRALSRVRPCYGTAAVERILRACKTVTARFWPWLSVQTVTARFWHWLSVQINLSRRFILPRRQ